MGWFEVVLPGGEPNTKYLRFFSIFLKINSVPQTAATTLAFSSVKFFFYFSNLSGNADNGDAVDAQDGPLKVLLGRRLARSLQRLAGTSRVVDQIRPLVAVVVCSHTLRKFFFKL